MSAKVIGSPRPKGRGVSFNRRAPSTRDTTERDRSRSRGHENASRHKPVLGLRDDIEYGCRDSALRRSCMSRRISSIVAGLGVLLIACGAYAAPAQGPVEKRLDLDRGTDALNAKKPKKGADADEAAEEEEASEKKSKKSKGKKGKKDA